MHRLFVLLRNYNQRRLVETNRGCMMMFLSRDQLWQQKVQPPAQYCKHIEGKGLGLSIGMK